MHPGIPAIKASVSILSLVETAVGITPNDREDADSSPGHLNDYLRIGRHGFATDIEFNPDGKQEGNGAVSCTFNYEHGGETAASTTFRKVVGETGWLCEHIIYGQPSNPATIAWLSIVDTLIDEFPTEFQDDNEGIYHIGDDGVAYLVMQRIAELIRLLPADDQVPGMPDSVI